MNEKPEPLNRYFRLVIIATAIFIITIFAMSANIMGDEDAPITSLIDRYAGVALVVEFSAILVFGFLAMAIDRRETLKQKAEEAEEEKNKQADKTKETKD